MSIIAQKIGIDFTDEAITSTAGSIFLSHLSNRLQLPSLLSEALSLKTRARGVSDVEMLLSLIYSLAQDDGCLLDVDRLAADDPRRDLLGLEQVPNHRRLGEYLRGVKLLFSKSALRLDWLAHAADRMESFAPG